MASISVLVERLWVYWRSRRLSRPLRRAGRGAVEEGRPPRAGQARRRVQGVPPRPAVRVRASNLRRRRQGSRRARADGAGAARDGAQDARRCRADIRRGLNVLASVGSVAPFVGLLGTVVGIIGAFQGIAQRPARAASARCRRASPRRSIVTAFGLMVAIPSGALFNHLSAASTRSRSTLERSTGELLDELENDPHGRDAGAWRRGGTSGAPSPRSTSRRSSTWCSCC